MNWSAQGEGFMETTITVNGEVVYDVSYLWVLLFFVTACSCGLWAVHKMYAAMRRGEPEKEAVRSALPLYRIMQVSGFAAIVLVLSPWFILAYLMSIAS